MFLVMNINIEIIISITAASFNYILTCRIWLLSLAAYMMVGSKKRQPW
jgi:hypothetical protein